jgi:type III secretion system HrpE/YscL family protein
MERKIIRGGPREGGEEAPKGRKLSQPPRGGLARGERRVMRQDHVEAENKAKEIIREAMLQADDIRANAHEHNRKGFEEGHQQGFEQGKSEWTERILQMNRENEARFMHFERDLVRLGLHIAEKIIGEQLRVEPNTITEIVAKAIHGVRHQKEIFIRVSPEDYETISASKFRLIEQLSRAQDIDIRADPEIQQGGCLIESETGSIDASLEKQIAAIEKILLGGSAY